MSKPRLCIDIDNVIAQTDEVMRRVIRDFTSGRVELRYEDVAEFKYQECPGSNSERISDEEWQAIHERFSDDAHIMAIRPFPGVQEHLERLTHKYSIHLATSRLRKARRATVAWLDRHGFPSHDLHFVTHGEKHASLGGFHAAVEDHYEQAIWFAEMGTPCFLLRHPWNDRKPQVENVEWVSDWPELVAKLVT